MSTNHEVEGEDVSYKYFSKRMKAEASQMSTNEALSRTEANVFGLGLARLSPFLSLFPSLFFKLRKNIQTERT